MDSSALINSLGIGAIIFAGLVLLWFLRMLFKRRVAKQQGNHAAAADQKISWEEKRKHPRVSISWPARINPADESMTVQLKDISLGGAFVVCQQPLPLSRKFRIAIEPPEQSHLELNAEVVWSNANVPEDKIINRGMGIRFINNSDDDRSRLNDLITSFIEESAE
jgi:hypothetical protein